MNHLKTLSAVAMVSLLFGFLGGIFAATKAQPSVKDSERVLRAERFEVIGTQGSVRASLALRADVPTVALYAPDGKERMLLALDSTDDPFVTMRDRKGNIRTFFGHETSDTASPDDDDWSITFQSAGEGDFKAAMGMTNLYLSGKQRGYMAVRDENDHPCAPKPVRACTFH